MIVLITPTGGRPKQWELCCRWMCQQTYTGKILWIVVDDCLPITTNKIPVFPDNWIIIPKHPRPVWEEGDNTQGRNMKVAIDIIKLLPKGDVEAIFIIEDDDYYSARYLELMTERLKGYDLVGEEYTYYYNIAIRKFHGNVNDHISLFQVAFTPHVIPIMEQCYNEKFIDIKFFKLVKNSKMFPRENLAIGIKGLPGRKGIGIGHNQHGYHTKDGTLSALKDLVGEDYIYYK